MRGLCCTVHGRWFWLSDGIVSQTLEGGQAGRVRLDVYDVLGREMRVQQAAPLQGWYSAGMHEVVWNAEGISSGVYVVRLTVEGGSLPGAETRQPGLVRKVVLVKWS